MKELNTFEELTEKIEAEEKVLIFITNDFCSVCHADLPRVDKLCNKYNFPAYHINITDKPMITGQFTLYSVPVVMLFFKGKEYHRQVHIIDFKELEYRIDELKNAPLEN